MKKKILTLLFSLILCLCIVTPAFAAQTDGFASEYERVQDLAGLLSGNEESSLVTKLNELSERQKMDIVVLTTDTLDGKTPRDYADDIYDYGNFGYGESRDGALLLISIEDNDWYISTCGYGFLAVNRYYRQTWLTTPYYAGYMSHPDEQLYMRSGNSNAGGSAYVKLQENSNNYVYLDSSRADIGSSGTARILAPKFAIGTSPSSGGTYGYTGSTQFIGCITNNGNNWTWGTINVVNGIITGMSSITGN